MRYFRLHRNHFFESPEMAEALFKASVHTVDIEVSSYCNRTCSFCTNSFTDRRSEQKLMDDKLFSNVMRQLGSIQFSGRIYFHRYNEPLFNKPYILGRLTEARNLVPNALLSITTNGDYLDREYVQQIYAAGCRSIYVSAYITDRTEYSDDAMKERILSMARAWGYPFEFATSEAGQHSIKIDAFPDLEFTITGVNYYQRDASTGDVRANDRGGALGFEKAYRRHSPCVLPFEWLEIGWNGDVMPCCHVRSDVPSQKDTVLAKLHSNSNIFEVWTNKNFVAWRRELIGWQLKRAPCTSCDYYAFPDNPDMRNLTAQTLKAAGVPELFQE